jgi:hypothetical protein
MMLICSLQQRTRFTKTINTFSKSKAKDERKGNRFEVILLFQTVLTLDSTNASNPFAEE